MKHIFFIHSHTLFLTSLGVVDYLCLNNDDVIFVYSRNYKSIIPTTIKTYDFSKEIEETYYIMLSWSRRNFFYNKRQRDKSISFFDNFVSDVVGNDKFMLYVPHLQMHVSQIMATNMQCEEMFFIQEGGRKMTPQLTGKISSLNRLYNNIVLRNNKRVWKCSNWFPNEQTPYSKPVSVFAFDNDFFGDAPDKIYIVKWPHIDINLGIHTEWPIFLLEGAVELGQIEKSLYIKSVKHIISDYARKNNYIKFHPAQSKDARKLFLDIFKQKGLNVEELPMDVPFELIVANYKKLDLYGFGTSLLFYGKAFGHHVTSREDLLLKSWRYRQHCRGLEKIN